MSNSEQNPDDVPYISKTGKKYPNKRIHDEAMAKKRSAKKQPVMPSPSSIIGDTLTQKFIGLTYNAMFHVQALLHALSGRDLLNSTIQFPGDSYNLLIDSSLDFTKFRVVIDSMITYINTKPDLLRALNSIAGRQWSTSFAQALVNEVSAVTQFIEFSASKSIRVPITSYTSYLPQNLTIGAARMLALEYSQPYYQNLGYRNGALIITKTTNLSSNKILDFVKSDIGKELNLDEKLLPIWTNYGPKISNTDIAIFSCIKEYLKDQFLYRTWDIPTLEKEIIPYGNAFVVDSSTSILDCEMPVGRMDIAFNQLYKTIVSGDITPMNIPIFKTYGQAPNPVEFKSYYLYVWTGIVQGSIDVINMGIDGVAAPLPKPEPTGGGSDTSPFTTVNPKLTSARYSFDAVKVPDLGINPFDLIFWAGDQVSRWATNPFLQDVAQKVLQDRLFSPKPIEVNLGITGKSETLRIPYVGKLQYNSWKIRPPRYGL